MRRAFGIDIGGTKCAVTLGSSPEDQGGRAPTAAMPTIEWKASFPTAEAGSPAEALRRLSTLMDAALREQGLEIGDVEAIGIGCGGPLDSRLGLILSPPNLPGWDEVPVVEFFRERYSVETRLQNDANACALAEREYGAGRGLDDLVFLTFGTGLGAGIIVGGRLLQGASSMAGELGHVRLADRGPVGYGKAGSFEGFCSGGGIAQLARSLALERLRAGERVGFCPRAEDAPSLDAKAVARAARAGEPLARAVFEQSGDFLGRGLAIVIDLLNPQAIIIGGIFLRCEELLRPAMERRLAAECLESSLAACRVLPAGLGESVGDYAALALAFQFSAGGMA